MFAAFSFSSVAGSSRKLKVCAISFVSGCFSQGKDFCFILEIGANVCVKFLQFPRGKSSL